MTRSSRHRARLAVLAAAAVVGAGLPLAAGSATAAEPLAAPGVVGPLDDRPVLKDVVLDWADVPGATGYVVEVGTDDEWADVPTLTRTTTTSRLALPASLPHASYVWRVAAKDERGTGAWSVDGTFTRGWRDRPTPLTPTAQHDSRLLPEFSWTPVPSASEYQVQVSTSPAFDDPSTATRQSRPLVQACFTTRTSVTPFNSQGSARNDGAGDCHFTLLGTGTQLYWRVRALDHVVDGMPEVDTTPVVDEGISHQPPQPSGELDTSACPTPAAQRTDSPSPVTTPSASPSASASATTSAAASATATASASPSSAPGGLPAASATPALASVACEPAHAVEKGPWSVTTAFRSILTATADDTGRYAQLPQVRTLPLPAELCTEQRVCRDFPTLRWTPVPGADWYRVYVALDDAYSNLQQIAETPGTSWTPTTQWRDSSAGAAYRYAVQPCTVTGRHAGCGPVTDAPPSFRKVSPRVTLAAPAADAVIGGGELVLRWQPHSQALQAATGAPATSEAYAYRVQVAPGSNPGFARDRLVEEALVDGALCAPGRGSTASRSPVQSCGSAATVVERSPATDVVSWSTEKGGWPQGVLLWRVQAVDASGRGLPWSTVRKVTVDSVAPTLTVTPTTDLAVDGALTVTFSEPVSGVDGRSLSLLATTARVVPAADRTSAQLRPAGRLIAGASYTVVVTDGVHDAAGNRLAPTSVVVSVAPQLDDRSPALAYSGAWRRLAASDAGAGTITRSDPTRARPTSVTATVSGRGVRVIGCRGPNGGILEVWSGGRRLTRVDTYRTYSGCGEVLTNAPLGRTGNAVVTVRGTGERHPRSKGTSVAVDGLRALS